MKQRLVKMGLKWLLVISVFFVIFGLVMFFNTTTSTAMVNNPISVTKSTYNNSYQFIEVIPTSTAKPNITYSIIVDNTLFKQSFTVSWNQLELAIEKPKTLTNPISQDNITAIKMHPSYSVKTYEITHTHPIIWVILPTLILATIIYFAVKNRTLEHDKSLDESLDESSSSVSIDDILEEVNPVGTYCPLPTGKGQCGAYNIVNYLKGQNPTGKLVKCNKCGRIYIHGTNYQAKDK